jgi:hypothetical protein
VTLDYARKADNMVQALVSGHVLHKIRISLHAEGQQSCHYAMFKDSSIAAYQLLSLT